MTTIILSILGIILAAAAATMVVFYGGNAFGDSSIDATANSIQNAGQNVIAASSMYKFDTGELPSEVEDLAVDGKYLTEVPSVEGFARNYDIEIASRHNRNYLIFPIDDEVCLKINQNLGLNSENDDVSDIPETQPEAKMGCYGNPTWYTFAARLGRFTIW